MGNKKRPRAIRPPVVPVDERCVRFSFEYLDLDHRRFHLRHCSKPYLDALLKAILRYQTITVDAFTHFDRREHRHPISFSDTSEPNGFGKIDPQREELWTDAAWQFGLRDSANPNPGWRVHGFLSDETFYIVWLDPVHALDGNRP